MPKSVFRVAAATAITALSTLAVTGHASAHSNTVVCIDQATSTWRIVNDWSLTESFTSPQGPSGTVAAGNGSYTDVVYVGDSLQIDAVWSDGFTESRTGTGDCTPEGGTTTTTTEFVTTTTEQGSTTSTPTTTTETTTTTVLDTTTTQPVGTLPTTSSLPSTSMPSSTSTSSPLPTSTTSPSSTSVPPFSTTTPSTTPECSDNPNTPTDECAPICQPVTLEDGTNSCGPSLPATGSNTAAIVIAAWIAILAGIVALGYGAAHRDKM